MLSRKAIHFFSLNQATGIGDDPNPVIKDMATEEFSRFRSGAACSTGTGDPPRSNGFSRDCCQEATETPGMKWSFCRDAHAGHP